MASNDFRNLGIPIEGSAIGKRLDYYLSENFPFFSRAEWQKRIDAKLATVNDHPTKNSYRLKCGDRLAHFHPLDDEPEVDTNVEIMWQDGGVLCAYKPSGLAMHEHGMFRRKTFREIIKTLAGPEWAAVHRLDLETSGIVLCAATEHLRKLLSDQLEAKQITKHYLAIAYGVPRAASWTVDQPIGNLKDRYARVKEVSSNGLTATTTFAVEQQKAAFSLLKASPITGRTNQIRVHAAHCGHPLVGDSIYAPPAEIAKPPISRTCLHAQQIAFVHPETNARKTVTSTLPADMKNLWDSFI